MNESELTAGVELDVLIEREVFGKVWVKHPYVVINGTRNKIETWLEEGDNPDDPSPGTFAGKTPPKRSSSLVSAWQVINKLNCDFDLTAHRHYEKPFQFVFYPSGAQAEGETEALAICLAVRLHVAKNAATLK